MRVHGNVPFYVGTDFKKSTLLLRDCLVHHVPQFGKFSIEERKSVHPFFQEEDPYDATKEEVLRSKWIEESKQLYGPFKVTGADRPLKSVNKSSLP